MITIITDLFNNKEFKAAKELILVVLKTDGNNVDLINMLAGCYFELKQYDEALHCLQLLYDKAQIQTVPIKINLAKILYYLQRAPEALQLIQSVIDQDRSQFQKIGLDLALYTNAIGNFEECFEILNQLDPTDQRAQFNKGWHMLRHGKFLEGFQHLAVGYECSVWGSPHITKFLPQEKKLLPGIDITNKTILYVCEGGLGDEMLFIRFVKILKRRGAKQVIVACDRSLISVFNTIADIDQVIPLSDLTNVPDYDYFIPAMNVIPTLELTDPYTGIEFPYINAKTKHVEVAKQTLSSHGVHDHIKIGIRWSGNLTFEHDQFRTIPYKQLLTFAKLGTLISIQRDADVSDMRIGDPIIDTSDSLTSWDATLGYLENMDYIVTSCTSIAHAGAALGKKVCIITPLVPYFTWAELKDTCDWYPTVHIFRQTVYNSWLEPIQSCYDWIKQDIKNANNNEN